MRRLCAVSACKEGTVSVQPSLEPECVAASGAIELTIEARVRSLGELDVRRVLPAAQRRMVGPFVFFDHMGPAVFPPGQGIAVRPHPHIGLATITYLFEGEIMHRDSLGYAQLIQSGAVNLMTAGRGIVHSERASERELAVTSTLHGIQSWMALPLDREEMEPSFIHYPADDLPTLQHSGCTLRVIMGGAFGAQSPVATYSPTLYFEARMPRGTSLELPAGAKERAAYVVSGAVQIDGREHRDGVLAVAREGSTPSITAVEDSRVMVIGGEPLGARHIWWNYVSSSRDRIERAKRDWVEGRIGKVPGDDEFIPLPDR
jgi:redox-sensitive bicupin YhaK (pirin superfamily)